MSCELAVDGGSGRYTVRNGVCHFEVEAGPGAVAVFPAGARPAHPLWWFTDRGRGVCLSTAGVLSADGNVAVVGSFAVAS